MKKIFINEKDNWAFWDAERLHLLRLAENNEKVGDVLAFQTNQFKIWTIHLNPGHTIPFHKHGKRYCWTALAAGKSRSYFNDGSVTETIYEIGDAVYFPDLSPQHYFIHNLENIGETLLIFSTIEFLDRI